MIDKNSFGENSQTKCEKLTKFIYWPIQAILTNNILIKKTIWDIILIKPCSLHRTNTGQNKKNKEN